MLELENSKSTVNWISRIALAPLNLLNVDYSGLPRAVHLIYRKVEQMLRAGKQPSRVSVKLKSQNKHLVRILFFWVMVGGQLSRVVGAAESNRTYRSGARAKDTIPPR
jgi:hypothetical protein